MPTPKYHVNPEKLSAMLQAWYEHSKPALAEDQIPEYLERMQAATNALLADLSEDLRPQVTAAIAPTPSLAERVQMATVGERYDLAVVQNVLDTYSRLHAPELRERVTRTLSKFGMCDRDFTDELVTALIGGTAKEQKP